MNELVGLVVTLAWAYYYPSVWALLGGAVIGRIFHVTASHILLPGISNQLHWDQKAFLELLHFGKWVFLSSMIFLLYAQGDRIILGKYFDAATLGIYSIALLLSEAASRVLNKLIDSVLYSALSRIINHEPHRLQTVSYRARLGTDALMLILIAIIIMMIGDIVVGVLYDSRYQGRVDASNSLRAAFDDINSFKWCVVSVCFGTLTLFCLAKYWTGHLVIHRNSCHLAIIWNTWSNMGSCTY